MMKEYLDNFTLGRVLWRSFFFQAAWNNQGMQNLGLASAILPALEKIHGPGTEKTRETLIRYLEPFNTQPYMAGPILGYLIFAESSGQVNVFGIPRFSQFLSSVASAFAAIGDSFFWNAMLPLAAVVAMFWALSGHTAGALIFLILYNIPHLAMRVMGFWIGCHKGLMVTSALQHLELPRFTLLIRLFCSAVLGALAIWAQMAYLSWIDPLTGLVVGVIIGPSLLLAAWGLKKSLPVETLIYGLLIGLLAFTHLLD
ncbi:MAG: PTS system mannose/fructose/sorbose family transporter subunit IID [Deltaproteobacteria bacterium]|nr:PTS system mannose/fructose/sorbose family transporter subunit IID [Deltaproteobacteria bacterium]